MRTVKSFVYTTIHTSVNTMMMLCCGFMEMYEMTVTEHARHIT